MTTEVESSMSDRPQYVPTPEDLNDAILVVLNENESPVQPSAKQVQKSLQAQNPTWKLPERRVAKFLKKQKKLQKASHKKEHVSPGADEASVDSTTSRTRQILHSTGAAIKSTKKSVRNMFSPTNVSSKSATSTGSSKKGFSFRKKKKQEEAEAADKSDVNKSTVTVKESTATATNLLPALDDEEDTKELAEEAENGKEASVEEAVTHEPNPEVKDRGAAVYEDDNSGEVEKGDLCSGCVIL